VDRRPPWKKPRPAGKERVELSDEVKAAARERAAKAGRRYPNLVDNMWAAQQMREKKT
jgi:hypothetical protein